MTDTDRRVVTSDDLDEAAAFDWWDRPLEPGIGLALSGGGFRAMLFHAGALLRLNELGLLSRVDHVTSVSGGSLAAGHLARMWPRLSLDREGCFAEFFEAVVEPLYAFSRRHVDIPSFLKALLIGGYAAEHLATRYDRDLFHGMTLADLPERPAFVFCATNLQTGVLWRFTKEYSGDYLLGYLLSERRSFRIAEAVAASSAFPPVFSPMPLSLDPSAFQDWGERPRKPLEAKKLKEVRSRVLLSDGGVYDNHGLEPIVKRYATLLVSDGGAPFLRRESVPSTWIRHMLRIRDLQDNQVRVLRRRDLIGRFKLGTVALKEGRFPPEKASSYERLGTYWGIDTQPPQTDDPGPLECMANMPDKMAGVDTRLSNRGAETSMQLVNWGYFIADRCVRQHLKGQPPFVPHPPAWPYPQVSMS